MASLINVSPAAPRDFDTSHHSISQMDHLEQRVSMLEEGIETTDEEMYRISHDFKVLLVEVSLVLDWLKEKFGVELINKESQIYKHIHYDLGSDEITAMKRSLSLPHSVTTKSEGPRDTESVHVHTQAPTKSRSTHTYNDNDSPDSDENLVIVESDAEPEDQKMKDPDFDATAKGGGDGESLIKTKLRPRRRRESTTSNNSSSDSINVHHQRSAWRRRPRSRARRITQTTGHTVTPFVRKLWRMVDDQETNNIIEWSADGEGFQIHDQFILAQDLLPFNFKHNNIASFVRQLNWYGFRKYPGLDAECRFVHKNFLRGRSDLLVKVRRRVADPDGPRTRTKRASPSMSPSPPAGQHDQEGGPNEDPLLDLEEMEEVTTYDPGAEGVAELK